ncbi:hypothetical protein [Sporosarcina sp. FSL K6-5500]|uniref:hypothetical protein n=1 Tax=Sporosarcina sp. FSL K6-5500 TaxID=2921558 RepID=UPI0030FA4F80
MKSLVKVIITTILFLSFIGPIQVFADNEFFAYGINVKSKETEPTRKSDDELQLFTSDVWKDLPTHTDVALDKEWVVTFNHEVNLDTANENVYVTKSYEGVSQIQDVRVVQHPSSLKKL